MNRQLQSHHRLLNAVISFRGADQHGSRAEIRSAAEELLAALEESQAILFPSVEGKSK
jgi:hypothetical protein